MAWLVENPWPIMLAGGAVELALLFMLFTTGRVKVMLYMVLAGAVIGGLLLVEKYVVTDREQIETMLQEIADALEQGDAKTVVAHISETAKDTRSSAYRAVQLRPREVRINNDLKIDVRDDVDPPQAEASATVTVTGTGPYAGTAPVQVKAWLRKVDGKWLIYDHTEKIGLK
jgi:hypothetical protein